MDLKNIKAFKFVAEMNSVSIAAQALNLTQPAVSKRIQLLEEELEIQLFDRFGRKLILTEAGKIFLQKSKEFIQLEQDTYDAISNLGKEVAGELRMITSHHVGLHRLPGYLKKYKQKYPEVTLNIQFKNSAETYQAILKGESELGITTQEDFVSEKITCHEFWHDELNFMVAKEHPLAKLNRISLTDIARYKAILPDNTFSTTRIVEDLFRKHDLKIQVDKDFGSNYLETIKALISIGDHWGVLPATMMDKSKLRVLNPGSAKLSRKLVCIHLEEKTLSRASKAFIELKLKQL